MRLNKDCIRDILLVVENKCVYYVHPKFGKMLYTLSFTQLCKLEELSKHNEDEIHYTVSKLFEGRYIEGYVIPKNNYLNFKHCDIDALIGDFSLGIMSHVAGEVMATYTKSMMNW